VKDPILDAPADVCEAVRAWRDGTATPEQQTLSYQWVIYEACQTYESAFSNDALMMARNCGRQSAGLLINGAAGVTRDVLAKMRGKERERQSRD